MTHNRTLIGTITDKARESWNITNSGYPADNCELWDEHWLATAKSWRDELQAEGLSETVKGLNQTIAFFEKVGGSDQNILP